VVFGILGLIGGAFIGFLLRPAVFLGAQVPFEAVITRGANLEAALVPVAEASFNYMMAGAIIGAVAGAITGHLATSRK
jgi:Na+/proline symporter